MRQKEGEIVRIEYKRTQSIHISVNNPPPSQIIQLGQAGESAAGDAGEGIEREDSAMLRIRDQCVRRRENSPNGMKWREEKEVLYDLHERKRDNSKTSLNLFGLSHGYTHDCENMRI